MKNSAHLCLCVTVTLLLLVAASTPAQTSQPAGAKAREVLTNEAVIKLAKERFKERTIIHLIRSSPTAFDISTVKLIELKRHGVSERIISEMIERQNLASGIESMASLRDDEFFKADDEAFFSSTSPRPGTATDKRAKGKDPAQPQDNETPVFGSSSGSQGRTRSRGLGNSGDQASQSDVTGTATVRIIRPRGEDGEPKLERAPKLDNREIIELIQAGFSEGTILRKIEITQVEFDLSAKAVAELRRNRVSERIIRAMTDAMGEEKKK
ncbi:MAG TPA: hypothetical protein VFD58_04770 [Blastocatellia bacterium]|nr:hypothetical protein [Blastocatellia bacterium]